jgi:hypothetical protein
MDMRAGMIPLEVVYDMSVVYRNVMRNFILPEFSGRVKNPIA